METSSNAAFDSFQLPGEGYKDTTAFKLVDGKAVKSFEMDGWVSRLFGYAN